MGKNRMLACSNLPSRSALGNKIGLFWWCYHLKRAVDYEFLEFQAFNLQVEPVISMPYGNSK